ncbi:hypothetical protein [uncultured Kingella sp.]|uniref:hypothetical protein n=1 Tax=uncultured Kingella sp. TaxID=159270 RepID=UPI002596FA34|nr:hypothetical protein [uncultured Kingella sp.]
MLRIIQNHALGKFRQKNITLRQRNCLSQAQRFINDIGRTIARKREKIYLA